MPLPATLPAGLRVMVRTFDGRNEATGRQEFRDFVGHVLRYDGTSLVMERDAAANGSRPAERVAIDAKRIAVIKPVPERHAAPRPTHPVPPAS